MEIPQLKIDTIPTYDPSSGVSFMSHISVVLERLKELKPTHKILDFHPNFHNPSETNPISTAKFLNCLDVSNQVTIPMRGYKTLRHFHYPLDAMIKTIMYQRINRLRYHSNVASHLETNINNCADLLGFEGRTPDRRTIGDFVNKRLGTIGLHKLHDALVVQLKDQMQNIGIKLGRRIGIDSTPLESMYNDEEGDYNGHYEIKMYKVHIVWCLDTGTPLFAIVTSGITYDGDFLIPALTKLKAMGIQYEEVYADNHYGSLENWAKATVLYGAKCYFNLSKNDLMRPDGAVSKIMAQYNRLWKKKDYKPDADFDYACKFLVGHEIYESVGAYYRNQWMKMWKNDNHRAQKMYNLRVGAERFQSILKEQLDFEDGLNVKGLKFAQRYAIQYFIAMCGIILTRVQNGVSEGFVKINRSAFY